MHPDGRAAIVNHAGSVHKHGQPSAGLEYFFRGHTQPVHDVRDIIGAYGTAEVNAGTSASASKAQVVTKGSISLALSGTGSGRTLGISFGNFVISAR